MSENIKNISANDISSLSTEKFNALVKEGAVLHTVTLNKFINGEYDESIANIMKEDKSIKRYLQLLRNSGVKVNFQEYTFNYNLFKSKENANLVLDTVDISTIDHNVMLDRIVRLLDDSILNRAIDLGVLEGVSVDRYVLLANNLGKTEMSLILAGHTNSVNMDELSLDSDVNEDEWEYNITPKAGLQLTKYIGTSNKISIPTTYNGEEVKGLKSTFLDDNEILHSASSILINYTEEDNDVHPRTAPFLYALSKQRYNVIITTNLSKETVSEACRGVKYDIDFYTKTIIYDAPREVSLVDDCVIYKNDKDTVLAKYMGNSKTYEIPDYVTLIATEAFANKNNLFGITIGPNSQLKAIRHSAFKNCYSLNRIDVNNSVVLYSISWGVQNFTEDIKIYTNGEPLNNLVVPEGIKSIADAAFRGNMDIECISIPASLTQIGENAFQGCEKIRSIHVDSGNARYTSRDINGVECNCIVDNKSYEPILVCKTSNIPEGIIKIPSKCFEEFDNIKCLTIPNGVVSISQEAVFNCRRLTDVIIPESVTYIDYDAFKYCSPSLRISVGEKGNLADLHKFWGTNAMGTKELGPTDIDNMNDAEFNYCVDKGYTLTKPLRQMLTDGGYHLRIFTKLVRDNRNMLKYLLLLHNSGLKADFSTYDISYEGFEKEEDARILLENIDLESLDKNLVLTSIIKHLSVDMLRLAIEGGILKDLSIGKYVALADSLGKKEHLEILKSHIDEDNIEEEDSELEEWTYTIDAGRGLVLTEYLGNSDVIVIPEKYAGQEVRDIDDEVFNNNEALKDRKNIVLYYDPKDKQIRKGTHGKDVVVADIFASLHDLDVVFVTSMDEDVVLESLHKHYRGAPHPICADILCKPEIDGDWLVDGEDVGNLLLYVGDPKDITFPVGTTKISEEVFRLCKNKVAEIHLPDTVKCIAPYAFKDLCVTKITIPASVVEIGEGAFEECEIAEITIPEGSQLARIEDGAFVPWHVEKINIPDMKTWCNITFSSKDANPLEELSKFNVGGNKLGNDLVIPEDVTKIGDYSFSGISNIRSVDMREGVTSIGEGAFNKSYNLESITIPSTITDIDETAFDGCENIKKIKVAEGNPRYTSRDENGVEANVLIDNYTHTLMLAGGITSIPDGIVNIQDRAFTRREDLQYITLPDSVEYIGNNAFSYCKNLMYVNIPNKVKTIGESAFYGCEELRDVAIDEDSKLETIGSQAFYQCVQITDINIPKGVKTIGVYAFYNCKELRHVAIDKCTELENIGDSAFKYCENLESFDLPPCNIKRIGPILTGCTSLKRVNIPDGIKEIGYSAFEGCISLENIRIPSSVVKVTHTCTWGCCSVKSVIVDVDNLNYTSRDANGMECNCIVDKKVNGMQFACVNTTIPENIESILECSFNGVVGITEIKIPRNITRIGESAFAYMNDLKAVYIPSSVEIVEDCAFRENEQLTIYAEASSRPSGWSKNWNPNKCSVKWKSKQ